MIHLVLLSGGSGTRLWPLSSDARSKRFLKALRDEEGGHVSMVQRVFSQIDLDVTTATCVSQQSSIEAQAESGYSLVLEPELRDAAPAVMLACSHLAWAQGADLDETVVAMPIDSYADQAYCDRAADLALPGVESAYASEKYGCAVSSSREGEPYLGEWKGFGTWSALMLSADDYRGTETFVKEADR